MPANPWIASIADAFINNALSALGAGARAIENPGEFLRDDLPPGADGLTRWIQDRNRRACRRHARNEAAGLYSNLGALRRPRYGHCRPYLDSINEGPITEGNYGRPFEGGQCPGVRYRVQASATINSEKSLPGDIPGFYPKFPSVDINCTGFLSAIGPIGPMSLVSLGDEFDTKQLAISVTPNSSFPQGKIVFFQASDQGRGLYMSGSSQTVTRCSGVDDCGDPPPEYRPPRYPTGLPPLPPTTIAPPGGDGDDDIEVDPDGNWRLCENGDCTPWFTPGGGGTPADPGGEEDGDPQETNPNDPNNPNEISGCVEDGKVLVGLKIEVIEHPITYDGNDSIYYRVGWIWMGPNENQLDLTVDGATIRDGQFIFPDGPDCSCYTVRANPGFRLRVQAFSRPREENNSE